MRILDNTKSLSALSIDTTNGLGNIQPLECLITEELNGIYEAEMTVLVSDEHFSDLSVGSILLLNTEKDNQMFRVYYISKPINQRCEVRLQHITYDLTKTPVKPFTSSGAVATCLALKNNVLGSTPFDIQTNIENTTSNFTLDIPRSFRECLGGYEGSMLDIFRGEYEWDNLTVKMLSRRGSDNGVRISYGKNLTDFKQEENIENVYDGVLAYAVVDDVTYTASSYYNKTGATNPRIKNVDFSSDYESGDIPTDAELITKETNYANDNDIEIPNVNITISFIPLWQTEEYKNVLPLERVSLGDTVHIYFDKLNVEASARVIKTVWNCLTEKYEEIELGNAKANLNTIIDNAVDNGLNKALSDIDIDTSSIEAEMNNLSRLIVNGLGLHISKDSANRIILHNEETIANSQYQYMISAQGFVVSDDYGQTWQSGWTTSGEAYMNSLSTIILRAMQIYGSVITFGDTNDKYIIAKTYANSSNVLQGVSFDGTGTIRMQPQEAFYLNNLTADGNNNYNRMMMSKNGTYSNFIELINYDDTQNYLTANFIELDAHYINGSDAYNRTLIRNNATITGTGYAANMMIMEGRETSNYIYLRNYKPQSSLFANNIVFQVDSSFNSLSLYNYKRAINYTANSITLNGTNTSNSIYMTNYQFEYSSSVYANYINWLSDSTSNQFYVRNYLRQTTQTLGNLLWLYSSSNESRVTIGNGKHPTSSVDATSNVIYMQHDEGTAQINQISISNRRYGTNSVANSLTMTSSGGVNNLRLDNYNSSGNNVNYIDMVNSPNPFMTIYSDSDLFLNSGGAVRLQSGNSQDITLTSADDISISARDKFYISIAGTQHQLSFGSDGNVKWS